MEKIKKYTIAAIAACIIVVCGATQDAVAKTEYVKTHLSDTLSIEQFIRQLSVNSAKEINLSKLARKRSKNSKVREYAVKVMDACILNYSQLKPFADARNITLADSSVFVSDQTISALKKSGSPNFDRQYLSIVIDDHNQTISLLERGAMFGDTAIVAFANKQLLVFRRNLEEGRYLSKIISGSKRTADRPRKQVKIDDDKL